MTYKSTRDYMRWIFKEDWLSKAQSLPEEDLYEALRDIILLIYSRAPNSPLENRCKRALGYLYAITRFIERNQRFPRREEQSRILERAYIPTSRDVLPLNQELTRRAQSSSVKTDEHREQNRKKKYYDSSSSIDLRKKVNPENGEEIDD